MKKETLIKTIAFYMDDCEIYTPTEHNLGENIYYFDEIPTEELIQTLANMDVIKAVTHLNSHETGFGLLVEFA